MSYSLSHPILIFCSVLITSVCYAEGAVSVLQPTEGSSTRGVINFVSENQKLAVKGKIEGLKPNSQHGFHVHEHGDCSAPDASSAGGHFNPTKHEHGSPEDEKKHAGDLGNLESDADGKATIHKRFDLALEGKESILGKGLIIHENPDDFKSQPTGNAGSRIACGVIKAQAE